RQSNGDRLFGGAGAVLSLANVVHLLANKFASLRAWRFAFCFVFLCAFQRFFFRHFERASLELLNNGDARRRGCVGEGRRFEKRFRMSDKEPINLETSETSETWPYALRAISYRYST